MDARELLDGLTEAGFEIWADGDSLVIRPTSKLTDAKRAALRAVKPELLSLLAGADLAARESFKERATMLEFDGGMSQAEAEPFGMLRQPHASIVAWDDRAIQQYLGRLARLRRWGWSECDAEALADKLTRRGADDDQVSCVDCRHLRHWRCTNATRAGWPASQDGVEVGRDLVALLQRCDGFDAGR